MDTILVVNAGSSSLKFQVFAVADAGDPTRLLKGQMDGIGTRPRLRAEAADSQPLVDRIYAQHEVKDLPAAIAVAGAWLRETQARRSGCRRASCRPWRPRLRPSGADRRSGAGASGTLYVAGAAASAEQSGADPRAARAPSGFAAGRLLRYRIPSHPRGRSRPFCASRTFLRGGRSALWLPRPLL